MNILDEIPREDLITMLTHQVWGTNLRSEFNRHGFNLGIDESTAILDINYRDAPLFDTREKAILECWREYYKK